MTRVVVLPHLQTAAIDPGDWLVTLRGDTMPVPPVLKGWDYSTPLRFECQVKVDLPSVLEECGLEEDAKIRALATYWASSTNRRGLGAAVVLDLSGDVSMSFDIDPSLVGGKLTLHRQLVLAQPSKAKRPFAATAVGAVLWSERRPDRTSVVLEGDAARFPTEFLDFSVGQVAEPSAAWRLEHDFSDLNASPLACLRLYINSSHPRLEGLIAGRSDDEAKLVSSVMSWDVGRMMVHEALTSNDFVDDWGHFNPGSLGEVLEFLVRRIWPTHDARALRAMRAHDHGLFEARLQGRLNILGTDR